MRIISVKISGFGPFSSEKKVIFDNGVNIIHGFNGSGKTNVMDAITWALFGPTSMSEKLKGDKYKVINNSSFRASVELTVKNNSDDIITIIRTLSGSSHRISVSKNGKILSKKISEAQDEINKELSLLSRDSYSSVTSISSSPILPVSPFISGSSSDRRKILSNLVDPEQKNLKRNKKLVVEIKNKKKEISAQEGKLDALRNSLENKKSNVPDVSNLGISETKANLSNVLIEIENLRNSSGKSLDIISESQARIDGFKNEKDSLIKSRKEQENSISSNTTILKKYESTLNSLFKEKSAAKKNKFIMDEYSIIQDLIDEQNSLEKEEISSSIKSYREKYISEKSILSIIEKASHSETCPVCDSDNNRENSESYYKDKISKITHSVMENREKYNQLSHDNDCINRYESMVNKFLKDKNKVFSSMKKVSQIESEIKSIENSISNKKMEINNSKNLVKKYNKIIDVVIPEKIKEQEDIISKISDSTEESQIEAISDKFIQLNSQKDILQKKVLELSNKETLADSMMQDIVLQQKEFDKQSKIFDDLELELQKLMEEKEETGVNGNISSLIKNACSEISENSTQVIKEVFPEYSQWDIELISEESNDDSDDEDDEDDIEKTLKILINGEDLSIYSHGEQMRIIISVSIGLCLFYEKHMGEWPVPLWDEPTMAIDGVFSDIAKSISNRYKGSNQFIISTRINKEEEDNIKSMPINTIHMVK